MRLMMFSKCLGSLPLAEAGRVIRDLGFDGVDLAVRPRGHVLPEQVRTDLPDAVCALADLGLAVPMITTNITAADEPHAVDIFEAAAEAGVHELKLGYWRYERYGAFHERAAEVSRLLGPIEALAQRTGVRASIHTHSGDMMSAFAPVIWHWIKDRDPAALGAYVDPMHMIHLALDGGISGWRMGLDVLQERISVVGIKDMDQVAEDGAEWDFKTVPLGRGIVPWPEIFGFLRHIDFDGWYSVHSDYMGFWSWRDLSVEDLIEQTRKDLAYLRQVTSD